MTERLTQERIQELLKEVAQYEERLNNAGYQESVEEEWSLAWTTLAIAKAKLQAMKGNR